MSRPIYGEWIISGTIQTVTPLAIGQGRDGYRADVDVVRDGLGRLVIPGTTLAGALRGHDLPEECFGGPRRATKENADKIVGSMIWIEDAPCLTTAPCTSVREGVAINRRTGAAAARMFYDFEVVEAGVEFDLTMRVEAKRAAKQSREDSINDAKRLAEDLITILSEDCPIGGGQSTGLGLVRLAGEVHLVWRDLSGRDGFLDYVTGTCPVETRPVEHSGNLVRPGEVVIGIPWLAKGPLLVSASIVGLVDSVPRVAREHTGQPEPVCRLSIPGSTLKGVFRSRAERIVRTLTAKEAPPDALDAFRQELTLIPDLFGRPPSRDGKTAATRGTLTFGEVVSSQPLLNWEDVLMALQSDGAAGEKPDNDDRKSDRKKQRREVQGRLGGPLMINDHVGIDRWTGGSDAGKLFADVAPWPSAKPEGDWRPIRIAFDQPRLRRIAVSRGKSEIETDDYCRAAKTLLVLLIRDFSEGFIGIGHATTRGYGEVQCDISQVEMAASPEAEWLWSDLDVLPADVQAWRATLGVTSGEGDRP